MAHIFGNILMGYLLIAVFVTLGRAYYLNYNDLPMDGAVAFGLRWIVELAKVVHAAWLWARS